jgi:maltooligosyltrehalose trehalohydrolase
MGEEYGETAPFLYFVSHGDPELVEAVRKGRRREFAAFDWQADPPDPQDEQTFLRSKLNRSLRRDGHHRTLYDFHRELMGLRTRIPALANLSKKNMTVSCDPPQNLLLVRRRFDDQEAGLLFNFNDDAGKIRIHLPAGRWRKRIDSAELRWMGPGSRVPDTLQANGSTEIEAAPHCVVVFSRELSD